jgi:hypothetical protein
MLPKLGQCPWQVIRDLCQGHPIQLLVRHFHLLTTGQLWQPDCEYKMRLQLVSGDRPMLGELMNIPTDTLIDMLYIILAGEVAITASEVEEIEQIQRELQRRGGEQCWSLQIAN